MSAHFGSRPHHNVSVLLLCLLLQIAAMAGDVRARTGQNDEADRKRTLELVDDHKFLEAMPLLEKLVAASPNDTVLLERLGTTLVAYAATLKDAEARKQVRIRARKVLLRSKEIGNDSNLLTILLDGLPEDGSDTGFSGRKEVDQAMRDGEAAFARGDDEGALKAYKQALLLDPKLYEAALFIGDVYFKKKDFERSGDWVGQAVQIAPNQETAYRYWGDALMATGKMDEARAKFVDAIIAEPYNRASWIGLTQWAQRKKVSLGHPPIEIPTAVKSEGGKTSISIDPASKEGSTYWMAYALKRAGYPEGGFFKEHPGERDYRHSLAEESAAFRAVTEAVARDVRTGTAKELKPSLANLIKLSDAGLVDAYILFVLADRGIAQDYDAYRAANRDKLRRYLLQVVLSGN